MYSPKSPLANQAEDILGANLHLAADVPKLPSLHRPESETQLHLTHGTYNSYIRGTSTGGEFPLYLAPHYTERRYLLRHVHTDGEEPAREHYRASHIKFALSGQASTIGHSRVTGELFDKYVERSESAGFEFVISNVRGVVLLGEHTISTTVPLVFRSEAGLVARSVIWAVEKIDRRMASLLAIPLIRTMESAYSLDNVAGAQIWHLRSGEGFFVAPDGAIERESEAIETLDAVEAALREQDDAA